MIATLPLKNRQSSELDGSKPILRNPATRCKYQILLESTLLLLIGLGVGNVLALATVKPLESGLDISIVAEGMAMMGASSTLYPKLTSSDMLLANSVVVLLGVLTSLLPAWRAAAAQEDRTESTP